MLPLFTMLAIVECALSVDFHKSLVRVVVTLTVGDLAVLKHVIYVSCLMIFSPEWCHTYWDSFSTCIIFILHCFQQQLLHHYCLNIREARRSHNRTIFPKSFCSHSLTFYNYYHVVHVSIFTPQEDTLIWQSIDEHHISDVISIFG